MIYLDSSALMKLLRVERESEPLGVWLRDRPAESLVTSELGRVEVLRAAARGDGLVEAARALLGDIDLVPLSRAVQDLAGDLPPAVLRTLDALHLASALLLRDGAVSFVAYDARLLAAAREAGLDVVSPGA